MNLSFISLGGMPQSTTAGVDVCMFTVMNAFETLGSEFLKQGGQTQQGSKDISEQ